MTDPKPRLNWNEESEQWEIPTLPSPNKPRHHKPAYPPETVTHLQRQRDVRDIRAAHRAIRTRWDAIQSGQGALPYTPPAPLLWLDFDARPSLHWYGRPLPLDPPALRLLLALAIQCGTSISPPDLAQAADVQPANLDHLLSLIKQQANLQGPPLPIEHTPAGYRLNLHPQLVLLPPLEDENA